MKQFSIKPSDFITFRYGQVSDHYKIGKLLGEGGQGEVRLCTHKKSGERRAVKMMSKAEMDENDQQLLKNEISALK